MEKKVLITGVTGGIGQALLQTFSSNGYYVIGHFCNDSKTVEKLKSIYPKSKAEFIRCDFSSLKNVETFSRNVSLSHPDIDCLINNAGVSHKDVFQNSNNEITEFVTNVNLLAPMILTREIIKPMISLKRGNIINISSIWGVYGGSCEVLYSATKGGLISFTKALSREVGLSSIRVNCISCGFINTPMNNNLSDEEKSDFFSCLSLNKQGTPQDVANTALFLASENASYITGQIIGVDGGY